MAACLAGGPSLKAARMPRKVQQLSIRDPICPGPQPFNLFKGKINLKRNAYNKGLSSTVT
jgi:hypothetical protein